MAHSYLYQIMMESRHNFTHYLIRIGENAVYNLLCLESCVGADRLP